MAVQGFDFSTGKATSSVHLQAFVLSECDVSTEVIEKYLRGHGHKFLGRTTDSRQALELVRKFKRGVVFLDADFSDIDAIKLIVEFKKKSDKFKIILMTKTPTKDLLTQGQAQGVSGFLVKPFNAVNIEKVLERVK